jgi:hypothetical protein
MKNVFKKESVGTFLKADSRLTKSLGARDLLSLGIGAVIGLVFLFYLDMKQLYMPDLQLRLPF